MLAEGEYDQVRVTLTDGSQMEVYQPAVSGDSLTGLSEGQQVSIPLASVSELELREGDSGKTVLLALGVMVGLAAVAAGIYSIACEECGTGGS